MDPTIIVVFIVGLFLGTLLNLIVIRLPRERNLDGWPRCTRCGRPLVWWQLLPLIGWLAQRGRGRCCDRPLHWLFPLIELISAGALALFYARYGFGVLFFYLAFVTLVLIVTGAIDWLHRSIYTFVILGATLIVLLAAALVLVPDHGFLNGLAGAMVAGFVFVIFFILARALFPGKSAPFGLGDVYLGIFIGAAVGWTNLLPSLFYGILLAGIFSTALIVARRRYPNVSEYISYGTFLCLGALGYLLLWGLHGI
jgi:leader peptidase (prepilin peptidase)/N-methyltransferase